MFSRITWRNNFENRSTFAKIIILRLGASFFETQCGPTIGACRQYSFYRAMLCIARTVPSQDVCPSVCHHAGILLKRLNRSSNFFHRPVATPCRFFPHYTVSQYSGRGAPKGGVECRVV